MTPRETYVRLRGVKMTKAMQSVLFLFDENHHEVSIKLMHDAKAGATVALTRRGLLRHTGEGRHVLTDFGHEVLGYLRRRGSR